MYLCPHGHEFTVHNQLRQVFRTWNLKHQCSRLETLVLSKCLLCKMKHIYKTKKPKTRYAIAWWRTKLSKWWLDLNDNDNNEKDINSLSLSIVWISGWDGSINICIQKCEYFKVTQELVRGTSNPLVANMYWMIGFKILVFECIIIWRNAK